MNLDFPTFLVLATALTGGIWLFDALWFAPRRRRLALAMTSGETASSAAPPREPVVVEYARAFFPVILLVLLLRSFLVEPFRIPSGSMMPTLLVGDFILVNKFAYGLRWPVINRKFLALGEPQRGDVVVFRYPGDTSTDYIKRVVGIPGDSIGYRDKMLIINGEPAAQLPLGEYQANGKPVPGMAEMLEKIAAIEHRILIDRRAWDFAPGCTVLAQGPLRIPPGHYFVMGDNRDNSNDSRCWGLVPEKNLVGKAFAIWMSWNSERPGLPIDFARIGRVIR